MQIQFNSTKYDLARNPYNYQTRFQCAINKGDYSVDSIIEDTTSPETITVYNDDGEVSGVYTGFTNRIAITIIQADEVQIEFENTDITGLLNQLESAVATQNSAIEELGEATSTLEETNETQDLAIEDLAEAVSELSEE